MTTVLILAGYALVLIGAFVPVFFDDLRRSKLWLTVLGVGLATMIISITIFSFASAPHEDTVEPDDSATLTVS